MRYMLRYAFRHHMFVCACAYASSSPGVGKGGKGFQGDPAAAFLNDRGKGGKGPN